MYKLAKVISSILEIQETITAIYFAKSARDLFIALEEHGFDVVAFKGLRYSIFKTDVDVDSIFQSNGDIEHACMILSIILFGIRTFGLRIKRNMRLELGYIMMLCDKDDINRCSTDLEKVRLIYSHVQLFFKKNRRLTKIIDGLPCQLGLKKAGPYYYSSFMIIPPRAVSRQ